AWDLSSALCPSSHSHSPSPHLLISPPPHFPIFPPPHFPTSSFPHFISPPPHFPTSSFPHLLISPPPHFPTISPPPHFPTSSFPHHRIPPFICPPAQGMHCASPGNDVVMPPLLPLTPPIPPDARNRSLPVLVLLGPPHRSPPLLAPPTSPPPAKDIPNADPTSRARAKHSPTDLKGNEGLTGRLLGESVTRPAGDGGNGGGGDWDRDGLWKEGEAIVESTQELTRKSTRRSSGDGHGKGSGGGHWDQHSLWKEGEGDDVAAADGVAGAAAEGGAAGRAGGAGETGGAGKTAETGAAGEVAAAGKGKGWTEEVQRRGEGTASDEGMGAAGGGFDREAVRGAFVEMVGTSNPKGWALLQLAPHAAAAAMQGAVFCVCLPDTSHWHEMVCMAQAVVNGCIPVTFFHHYRHPWLHSLPFSAFSLNIDPMDVHETAMRLDVMLLDMSLLWRIQTELHSVQQRLLYNESAPISAVDQVSHSLP
ncbi:unnamed protein product, partial [Closterium sp. NIES-53]